MAEVKREVERKYEGPAQDFDLPDLTGVRAVASIVDQGLVALDAVYYDTADQRLAAHKITLRRRTGGADAGWHLKVPLSKTAREEIHAPLDEATEPDDGSERTGDRQDSAHGQDGQDTHAGRGTLVPQGTGAPAPGRSEPWQDARTAPVPPAELTGLVRSRIRNAPLVPVVRLRSARRLTHLVDAAGALLAEVSIDHVHAQRLDDAQGPGACAEWTEAEVELADGGSPHFLDEVEVPLREAGWRPSDAPSKLSRALQETASGPTPPAYVPPAAVGGCADHVLAYLRTQRDALVDLDPAVRRELPDSVHRMRVATRRARSVLRSYRNVLDRTATAPVAAELKWLAAELGVDRDREVLTERLSAGLDDLPPQLSTGPVHERLRTWSQRRHGDAHSRLVEVLDSARYLTLLAALDDLLAAPPLRKAATGKPKKVFGKALRRADRRLDTLLAEALRQPPGESRDTALHQARKATKRLRYTAEAAAPALGGSTKKTVSRAKALQSRLGDHQDSVLARRTLRDLAAQAHAAGESSFTYGVLYGREEQRAAADEKALGAKPGKH